MRAAVLVGCSQYDDPDIADLKYAHEDAVRFGARLRAVAGVDEPFAATLYDGAEQLLRRPTRGNVLRALTALPRTLPEPVEMLYFFFSGHGFHSAVDNSDYLLVADSLTDALEETSLRFDLVLRLLGAVEARHVLLFLDACRATVSAGKSVEARIPRADVVNLCPPGMASFCSCEPHAVSYEADELGAGLFSAALCDALDEVGRCVTVQELDHYLGTAVPALSRRTGKPVQRAHTRVEPLPVKDVEIVSPRVRNMWRTSSSVGEEVRRPRSAASGLNVEANPLVSIDLGTSFSAAALCDQDGAIRLAPANDGRTMVPSVVSFLPDLNYRVGSDAIELELHDPSRTVRHVKRHLGTGRLYQIGERSVSAELVASLLVRSLRDNAAEAAGTPVRRCMTAYPANFSIRQANALLRAFELAGLDVVRMTGEPNIAALLLERVRPGYDGICLIVDLGGGTFDVAVAGFGEQVCHIWAVAGDNELGGLDYDEAILGLIRRRLTDRNPSLVLGDPVLAALRREAERAKRVLGTRQEALLLLSDIETETGFGDVEIVLSREDVRDATRHLNDEVRRVVRSALEEADQGRPDLVLLSGQGGKIFTVREAIRDTLREAGSEPEFLEQFQELAVVRGLAEYSKVLSGRSRDLLLLDLTHRGIGIRSAQLAPDAPGASPLSLFGATGPGAPPPRPDAQAPSGDEHVRVLLSRLTTIPTKRSEVLYFRDAPGTPVACTVVERSKTADEDVIIGDITLPAPGPKVGLEFTVDVDANSTILLQVEHRQDRWRRAYQLNHHYRVIPSLDLPRRLTLLLDGWTLFPMRKLRVEEAAGDPATVQEAGETLRTIDVQREFTDLHARRTELELARQRARGEPWYFSQLTVDVVGARIPEARLLVLAGRHAEALALMVEAAEMLGGERAWQLAERLCAAACEAIAAQPKRDRAHAADRLVDALLPALTGADNQWNWRADAVRGCVEALKAAGARRQADRLAASTA